MRKLYNSYWQRERRLFQWLPFLSPLTYSFPSTPLIIFLLYSPLFVLATFLFFHFILFRKISISTSIPSFLPDSRSFNISPSSTHNTPLSDPSTLTPYDPLSIPSSTLTLTCLVTWLLFYLCQCNSVTYGTVPEWWTWELHALSHLLSSAAYMLHRRHPLRNTPLPPHTCLCVRTTKEKLQANSSSNNATKIK